MGENTIGSVQRNGSGCSSLIVINLTRQQVVSVTGYFYGCQWEEVVTWVRYVRVAEPLSR